MEGKVTLNKHNILSLSGVLFALWIFCSFEGRKHFSALKNVIHSLRKVKNYREKYLSAISRKKIPFASWISHTKCHFCSGFFQRILGVFNCRHAQMLNHFCSSWQKKICYDDIVMTETMCQDGKNNAFFVTVKTYVYVYYLFTKLLITLECVT